MINTTIDSNLNGIKAFSHAIQMIDNAEKPCSNFFSELWAIDKPLSEKKILLNCHLTRSTLILVDLFISAGAELHITCSDDLVCHHDIKDILVQLNLYFSQESIFAIEDKGYYDLVVDCGASFSHTLTPKYGFVELTHVPESHYGNVLCPILSIDKSVIKKIETCLGTGDGFVRSYKLITARKHENITKDKFMIFGYGKVGRGIAACLLHEGVNKKNITIIEKNTENYLIAKQQGLNTLLIDREMSIIKNILKYEITCTITATGITNCISNFFESSDFENVPYLVNMGTYDEWGMKFSNHRILNEKKPFNFILEYPTKVIYLDPIFTLLVYATINLIEGDYSRTYPIHTPSMNTQKHIMDIWLKDNPIKSHVDGLWLEEKKSINAA